jgi:hypothetical protein
LRRWKSAQKNSLSISKRRLSEEGIHKVVEHSINLYKCALRKICQEGTRIPLRNKGMKISELE